MNAGQRRAVATLKHLLHASVDEDDVVLLARAEWLGQEPLRAVVHRAWNVRA